ncbi:MAG: hypothetical protein AAF909_13095, partial [Pseudomonadota bacterium]
MLTRWNWIDTEPDEAERHVAARLRHEPQRRLLADLSGTIVACRRAALSCYPDYALYDLRLETPPTAADGAAGGGRGGRVLALVDERPEAAEKNTALLLNGRSTLLPQLNERVFIDAAETAALRLKTADEAREYLELYCLSIGARAGPFFILSEEADLQWRPDPDPERDLNLLWELEKRAVELSWEREPKEIERELFKAYLDSDPATRAAQEATWRAEAGPKSLNDPKLTVDALRKQVRKALDEAR